MTKTRLDRRLYLELISPLVVAAVRVEEELQLVASSEHHKVRPLLCPYLCIDSSIVNNNYWNKQASIIANNFLYYKSSMVETCFVYIRDY